MLIYPKATFIKKLSADLHGFRRANPDFPDQSTSNQFFGEKQFEAYRELGFQLTFEMLRRLRASDQGTSALEHRAKDLLWKS